MKSRETHAWVVFSLFGPLNLIACKPKSHGLTLVCNTVVLKVNRAAIGSGGNHLEAQIANQLVAHRIFHNIGINLQLEDRNRFDSPAKFSAWAFSMPKCPEHAA